MRINKLVMAIVLFFTLLSFVGCVEEKTGLSIRPEIYEYSLNMSSSPGIPLVAQFTRDLKNKDYKYHWIAERGTFLKWHKEGRGRIEELGSDIKTNEHKVYWAVDPDEEIGSGKVMHETTIQIDQQRKGYFTIKEK